MIIKIKEQWPGLIAVMCGGLLALSSCVKPIKGEGPIITDSRSVPQFDRIEGSGSEQIEVFPSTEYKVEVTAHENLAAAYETNVSAGVLQVHMKDRFVNVKTNTVRVKIFAPALKSVQFNGSGGVNVHWLDTVQHFTAKMSGSGHINIEAGSLHQFYADMNGSGEIYAYDALSDSVTANHSGSGNIRVSVSRFLDGSVSGSGNITYKGNPVVRKSVKGSGDVKKG
jgi:hypothetical protein